MLLWTLGALASATSSGLLADLIENRSFASSCVFSHMDCDGMVTPPGFIRDFGTDDTAQQSCCAECAKNPACEKAVLALDQGGVCMLKPFGSKCSVAKNRLACDPQKPPSPAPPPAPSNNVPKWTPTYNMSESTVVSTLPTF